MSDRLNVPCPYCQMQCRVGMSHECGKAPEGCAEVKIIRKGETIIAQVFGKSA